MLKLDTVMKTGIDEMNSTFAKKAKCLAAKATKLAFFAAFLFLAAK
jgi:hypothetical protein